MFGTPYLQHLTSDSAEICFCSVDDPELALEFVFSKAYQTARGIEFIRPVISVCPKNSDRSHIHVNLKYLEPIVKSAAEQKTLNFP